MRARIVTSVIIGVAAVLATTGCSYFATQSTLEHYDPSDGVGATVGNVDVRNALLLTKNGKDASLVVDLINGGESTVNVSVQYDVIGPSGTIGKVDKTIRLDAGEVKGYGGNDEGQLILNHIKTRPGALFPVFVQYGDTTGKQVLVPVLNGALSEYSKLLPTPTPTPTSTADSKIIPLPTASDAPAN